MSQIEIYELLEKNPRLCLKEISEILNKHQSNISQEVYKMIKYKELIASQPTDEEIKRISKQFPGLLKHAGKRLKVFETHDY